MATAAFPIRTACLRQTRLASLPSQSRFSTASLRRPSPKNSLALSADVETLLARPTWSLKSLLPTPSASQNQPAITSQKLRHLLRLSALPPPGNAAEEANMLRTLSSQLHFVQEIQQVDTTGVAPLQSLQDETAGAEKEHTISLDTLSGALAREDVIGKHHKRIRRKTEQPVDTGDAEAWDVLAHAEKKMGKYFVVDSAKD